MLALAAATLAGCAGNRFQLANRRAGSSGAFANQGDFIVPPVPQPAPTQPAPGQMMVPGNQPLPQQGVAVTPDPFLGEIEGGTGTAGPVPQNSNPIVDQDFADVIPRNPNMTESGARNRRRVTETPRPGPEGTSQNLASNGPELVGRVLDEFGRPVPYASIQVRDVSRSQLVAEVASEVQGVFRVRNVIPGAQYELNAAATDQGRRLIGSTLAVAPDTAVIVQVQAQSAGVSRVERRDILQQDAYPSQGVVPTGFGKTTVSTPALLPSGLLASGPSSRGQDRSRASAPDPRANPSPQIQPARPERAERSGGGVSADRSGDRPASSPAIDNPYDYVRQEEALEPAPEPPAAQSPEPKAGPMRDIVLGGAFAGTPLETMELLTTTGQRRPLGRLAGDLILLDFFGSWCGPCRQCVPKLNAVHREYATRGLRLIGVACENGSENQAVRAAENARMELAIEYSVLVSPLDSPSPLRDHFNVSKYPTLVLLDRSGKVLFEGTGGSAATFDRLRQAIDRALSDR